MIKIAILGLVSISATTLASTTHSIVASTTSSIAATATPTATSIADTTLTTTQDISCDSDEYCKENGFSMCVARKCTLKLCKQDQECQSTFWTPYIPNTKLSNCIERLNELQASRARQRDEESSCS